MKIVSENQYLKNNKKILYVILLFLIVPGVCLGGNNLSIFGTIYNDTNLNNQFDAKDTGIYGIEVILENNTKELDSITTSRFGNYSFHNLGEGKYTIKQKISKQWIPSSPDVPYFIIPLNKKNANLSIDFLNRKALENASPLYYFIDAFGHFLSLIVKIEVILALIIIIIIIFHNKLSDLIRRLSSSLSNFIRSQNSEYKLLILVVVLVAVLIIYIFKYGEVFYIIPVLGIASLVIPLILSLTNRGFNLNSGEIRKVIVISLTVIYILFTSISFHETSNKQGMEPSKYVANLTMIKDGNKTNQIGIYANISSSNGVIFLPQKLDANFSKKDAQVFLVPASNFTSTAGKSVPIPVGNVTSGSSMVPLDAISDFSKSFLYVYLIIILFYFGSRFIDERSSNRNLEKFIKEDVCKVAGLRLALGDIGPKEYQDIWKQFGYEGMTRNRLCISNIKCKTSDNKSIISFDVLNPTNSKIKICAIIVSDRTSAHEETIDPNNIPKPVSYPLEMMLQKGTYDVHIVTCDGSAATSQLNATDFL